VVENANERVLPLLQPEARQRADARAGYLDLLGRDLEPTGPVQDLMRSGIVIRIYERWWRPALGRMAKGVFGPGMADEHRIARLLLALAPGDGVLDVACGPGNFSREFARSVGETGLVVGIDASRPMLERAVREAPAAGVDNLVFVHGDAVTLPFRDQSFDAVCCYAAFHLFADPFKALDHMRRVLTPGGRIALFTTCHGRSAPLRTFESLMERRSGMRMFEQREITGALERRGFTEIRQRIAGFTQFVGGRLPAGS
jgi:ubiquinone/menaquinone biosynthesis C-methylase UbiE